MASRDPDPPNPPRPEDAPDALTELRERLARTQEAAERLAAAATERLGAAGGGGPRPPRADWQVPGTQGAGFDPWLSATLGETLRRVLPHDLQRELATLARELLLALRALIDYCLERLAAREGEPVEVQDIPIS